MRCIRNRVIAEFEKGWIGSNSSCEYHPCHHKGQDCTYCYCPFYPCNDKDLGKMLSSSGKEVWDCSDCLFIHRTDVCKHVSSKVKDLNITDPDDPRLADMFKDVKNKFFKLGRSIMVLGATSDAGKSLMVTAICRVISDMGFTVSPLKTQNMSLNSVVTDDGSEIAMIQSLQAKAAGIKRPGHHINPILLKPKGDTISQIMVHGRPVGDMDVTTYYNEFIPNAGIKAARESIEYLRKRYDFVVIEGAGSPAEINIYDVDIANMKAAEMADASCILVVNTERGGSFAYALGTLELLPPEDRKRIKAVLFNNLCGNKEDITDGVKEFEGISNVPSLGVMPHVDIVLPNEDSAYFKGSMTIGNGRMIVSVIRFPRISNFTDIDPLGLEDVTVRFVESPEELEGSDAIIIPGTKNTISDMLWMRSSGIADAILGYKGKIPILGICGGYQMMGSMLSDQNGIEGSNPSDTEGLGLFKDVTKWSEDGKKVRRVSGTLIPTEEDIRGYEIHMGDTDVKERPLFRINDFKGTHEEGSLNEKDMLFGTYLHGVFETPSFRRYFLGFASPGYKGNDQDHSEMVDQNIQKLADSFVSNVDMELFKKILDVDQ